ncbi:polysaccharide lyase family 4 protein [Serendipita vermifera MAFF 305830]|uniref:rhamnogalacturonan endolyase n=1 Tax=Serendipita vermifera MAFF 305830 TaxID=933852 RepID=A0A0C3BJE0_SERVB|nr:polysaccharide lyase family 4 protein [Serendipita vermifera MAFF 305830]
MRFLRHAAAVLACIATPIRAAFSLTESSSTYVVDTNAGLVFTVQRASCDITSILYNGVQMQDQSKYSHIGSGLGSVTASWTKIGNYYKITCATSTLTQYIVGKYNHAAIHLATYTTAEPSIGELRFIARLNKSVLTTTSIVAAEVNGGSVVEGSDVFLVSGQTRSKFYSSRPFIDDHVHGVSGSGYAAWMVVPGLGSRDYGFELCSGGPFFRDIDNQGSAQQELYFYMNSGHMQTEAYRQGLHGPYFIEFNTGSTPSADYDASFWESLSVSGLTTFANRGYVTGTVSGIPSAYNSYITVGFSNSAAQYWVRADSSTLKFTSPKMKPGTYTMTLYKMELEVKTQSVTVSAGSTTTSNIASAESTPTTIWQIGEFDGTPRGFLNADLIETMHPSDSRMHDWVRPTFTLSQGAAYFPMALFKDVGTISISFSLTSAQIGARTLRIAVTSSFAGGRPVPTIGSWTGATPAAPTAIDSRGVTRGTWRGYNISYTWSIPSGILVTGYQTLTIAVASGSSGTTFLSPNFVFDALSLY